MTRRPAPFPLAPVPVPALLGAIALLAASLPAAAQDAGPEPLPAPPPPVVESVTPTGYRVRVPVGEVRVVRDRLFGFDVAEISVPGGSAGTPWGEPALPTRTILLRVPWGTTPAARGVRVGPRDLGALVPAPGARLLTEEAARRLASPRAVAAALEGPAYRALGRAGEAPAVARAVPMAAAGERYLAVTLQPVTWDAATRAARTSQEIVIEVSWDRPVPALEPPAAPSAGAPLAPPALGPRYPGRARSGGAGLGGGSGGPARAAGLAPSRAASGPLRVDPTRSWVRLTVARAGLYQITAADLAAAGIASAGIDPSTFRLYRSTPGDLPESLDVDLGPDSLREVAIEVTGEGDGTFNSGDVLRFYATGETGFGYDLRASGGSEYQETQRTDLQPMWLTWDLGPEPSPPRRMPSRDAAPGSAPLLTSVTHRAHFEENIYAQFDLFQAPLRWERWFRDRIESVTQTERRRYVLTLPGAIAGGATALRVRVWGAGSSAGSLPDHVTRLYWNRALVDSAAWNLSAPRDLQPSGMATNGVRDTLELEVPFLGPNRVDQQYLAWIEASYPRALVAVADTLHFAAPDSVAAGRFRYAIGGVSDTTAARLLDRTDPESPVRLTGGVWSGAAAPFTLTVEDSAGPGHRPRYSLVSTARAATPSIARYAPASSQRSLADLLNPANEADYLIVAPPAFLAAAEALAADRSALLQGFPAPRAAIATTERIEAQLGGGRPDPVAIRNLIAFASRHWALPPLYVCLLGDASDDPKNYSHFAAPDWVPTQGKYWDSTLHVQFTSDDFFAFLDGPSDKLFDVALGRLPAHDAPDALQLVNGKRAAFERNAEFDWWRARALLTADDGWKWSIPNTQRDGVGADHVRQMERKDAFHIPFPVRREKVYLNDYAFSDSTRTSKPAAREAFIAAVNAGSWLVDFIGHGNETLLADEQVFRSSDLGRLTNQTRPAMFGFFSCTVGKFDDRAIEGLAESLLRLQTGGAAVSLAASQEAFGSESTALNDSFVDELFPLWADSSRADTLRTAGLAWARAKSAGTSQNEVARKYAYLGDPALVPPLPRGRGIFEKGPLDSIPRGEVAAIAGHALNPDGSRDTLSTGTARLEVLGPPSRRVERAQASGQEINVPYLLPGAVLFRGETALDRGAFTLRFVVPTDGRVIGRGSQIRALLSEAGGEGVGLAADSLRIATALSPRVDGTPPVIRLRYAAGPDSSVAPGSILTFEIEDSSGVDLTRLDDAHSIFVIVDDRGTPFNLTPTFRYEPSSWTRGTATFVLPPLEGGAHLLEVHASDTYRNVGVARFTIDVATSVGAGTALTMTEVFNYPNPFPRETFLHARLNRAARLRIQVLTVSGRLVRDFEVDGRPGENYVPWNGRDSRGENVAVGVYLVKLTASASGGSRVTAVARALRTE